MTLIDYVQLQKQPLQLPQHRKPQQLRQPQPRSLMLQPQPHQEITLVQEEVWLTVSTYVQMIHLICIRSRHEHDIKPKDAYNKEAQIGSFPRMIN